ncbi:hypothetical protein JXI42_00705 [bacterium]|nr:hypothetical protein [bacterium]
MFKIDVRCPVCNKILVVPEVKIDNEPAIFTEVSYEGKWYPLYLSSLYGSYNILSEVEIKQGDMVKFRCPFCKASLMSKTQCEACEAPLVHFGLVETGGIGELCSRNGCRKHYIKFKDIEEELKVFLKTYNINIV